MSLAFFASAGTRANCIPGQESNLGELNISAGATSTPETLPNGISPWSEGNGMAAMLKYLSLGTCEIDSLGEVCILHRLDALARHIDDGAGSGQGHERGSRYGRE